MARIAAVLRQSQERDWRWLLAQSFPKEMWALYEKGLLHPDVELTGRVKADTRPVNIKVVQQVIENARKEEEARLRYLQEKDD